MVQDGEALEYSVSDFGDTIMGDLNVDINENIQELFSQFQELLNEWLDEAGINIDMSTGYVVTTGPPGLLLQELDSTFDQETFANWWNGQIEQSHVSAVRNDIDQFIADFNARVAEISETSHMEFDEETLERLRVISLHSRLMTLQGNDNCGWCH